MKFDDLPESRFGRVESEDIRQFIIGSLLAKNDPLLSQWMNQNLVLDREADIADFRNKWIPLPLANEIWSQLNKSFVILIDNIENYLHPPFIGREGINVAEPQSPYGKQQEYTNNSSLLLPSEAIIGKDEYTHLMGVISREPEFMKKLDPHKFEDLIAEILRRMGYVVEQTRKTRDGGYDMLAIGHTPLGPNRIAVECKRYTESKIGVDIVRNLYAVKMLRHFNQAMLVTTSSFSKDAWLEIKNLESEVLLKDQNDIKKWCADYGITPILKK